MKYELKLNFEKEEDKALETINQILGNMKLTSCKLVDEQGPTYKNITYKNGKEIVFYSVEINSITLACEHNEGEEEAVFQIETPAFAPEDHVMPGQFVERWKRENPDKTFNGCTALMYQYATGYVVLYKK